METIKSKREFEKVFKSGERANHRLVRITVMRDNEGDSSQVAFVAAKRLGNAVYRNRCKRILREAARAAGFPQAGCQVIFFATPRTKDAHPEEVGQAITSLMKRIVAGKNRVAHS